jgi:hypothetical protein
MLRFYIVVAGRRAAGSWEAGRRNDDEVEVLRGLDHGEHVILYPTDTVPDGARVAERRGSSSEEQAMSDEAIHTEEHRVSGERLVGRVKELIHQGNVRRIIVKNDDGQTILEIPLTLGVVGAVLVPSLVALGAIAALAADYTVVIQKETSDAVMGFGG